MKKSLLVIALTLPYLFSDLAQAEAASATDRKGDVADPRVDISELRADYADGHIRLELLVPSSDAPETWKDGSFIEWKMATDNDQFYEIRWGGAGKAPITLVESFSRHDHKRCEVVPEFSAGVYRVTFEKACIGNPRAVSFHGAASRKDPGGANMRDDVPDNPPDEEFPVPSRTTNYCCVVQEDRPDRRFST